MADAGDDWIKMFRSNVKTTLSPPPSPRATAGRETRRWHPNAPGVTFGDVNNHYAPRTSTAYTDLCGVAYHRHRSLLKES